MRERVAGLRRAFDSSFARPAIVDASPGENVLAVSIRSQRYAFRLRDISGLHADKRITRVPSPVPALLGIAGFRGTVLPVYDLGLLLGHAAADAPRWLVVAAGEPVALAFDAFDQHLRVPADAIVPDLRGDGGARHVREVLHAQELRPVIHVASVLASIRNLVLDDQPRSGE
jgi:purine-binding chemotaxis protein CheW